MKKIYLLSRGEFAPIIANAIEAAGCIVKTFNYDQKGNNTTDVLKTAIFGDKEMKKRYFNMIVRERLLPAIHRSNPDFVLILKGDYLDDDNYKSLKNIDVPVIYWAYDSLERYPSLAKIMQISNHKLFIDGGDVLDESSFWFPMGFDEHVFKPVDNEKCIDVLFIGQLIQPLYSKRLEFLIKLSESDLAHRYKCAFVGTLGSRKEDIKLEKILNLHFLGRVSIDQYAKYIANSKICINIHQSDGRKAINPSFFAIPGCRTCQIAENHSFLTEWLKPGKDYVAFKDDEFLDVIQHVLEHRSYQDEIAHHGYMTVLQNHTFTKRIEKIFSIINDG